MDRFHSGVNSRQSLPSSGLGKGRGGPHGLPSPLCQHSRTSRKSRGRLLPSCTSNPQGKSWLNTPGDSMSGRDGVPLVPGQAFCVLCEQKTNSRRCGLLTLQETGKGVHGSALLTRQFCPWMTSWERMRVSKQTQAGLGGGTQSPAAWEEAVLPTLTVCSDVHLSVQSRVAEGPERKLGGCLNRGSCLGEAGSFTPTGRLGSGWDPSPCKAWGERRS